MILRCIWHFNNNILEHFTWHCLHSLWMHTTAKNEISNNLSRQIISYI